MLLSAIGLRCKLARRENWCNGESSLNCVSFVWRYIEL